VANSQGATIRNGLGMLVHQAAGQVRLFSGQDAPVEAMWEEVRELSTS
jgi:shikimate dehydrogenase